MPKMLKETWIEFSEFERWTKENHWLLFSTEEYKDCQLLYYILPDGTSCKVSKKDTMFGGFA